MIVQCQKCQTKFNLDESRIGADGAWVRCSNCQDIFEVFPPDKQPEASSKAEDADLDLDMMANGKAPGTLADDLGLMGEEPAASASDMEIDLGIDGDRKKGSGPGGFFKVFFWLIAIIILLAVLLVGGLMVLDHMKAAPHIVDRFRSLPYISKLLSSAAGGQTSVDAGWEKLRLTDARVYYINSNRIGRIAVIKGHVDNKFPDTRTEILVQALLVDSKMQVVREAVVYAGHDISDNELLSLTLEQIQARLGSPKGPDGSKYIVTSGGAIPFTLVFANLPGDINQWETNAVGSKSFAR